MADGKYISANKETPLFSMSERRKGSKGMTQWGQWNYSTPCNGGYASTHIGLVSSNVKYSE